MESKETITPVDGTASQAVMRRQFEDGVKHVGKLEVTVFRENGEVEINEPVYNARVNNGASVEATQLFTSSASAVVFNYLALTSTNITINATDTALSGEIVSGGLARFGPLTWAYTAPGSLGATYAVVASHTWTATASNTVYALGLFSASSGGQLYSEASLSPSATLASGDSLQITYTINS